MKFWQKFYFFWIFEIVLNSISKTSRTVTDK